jgi:hypothetical protein
MSLTQAVLTRTKGALDRGFDAAPKRGWLPIEMARDWRVVYPPAN